MKWKANLSSAQKNPTMYSTFSHTCTSSPYSFPRLLHLLLYSCKNISLYHNVSYSIHTGVIFCSFKVWWSITWYRLMNRPDEWWAYLTIVIFFMTLRLWGDSESANKNRNTCLPIFNPTQSRVWGWRVVYRQCNKIMA